VGLVTDRHAEHVAAPRSRQLPIRVLVKFAARQFEASRGAQTEACGVIPGGAGGRSRLPAGSAVRFSARHHVRRRTDPYRQVSAHERPLIGSQ
jgi:hypothetical protein